MRPTTSDSRRSGAFQVTPKQSKRFKVPKREWSHRFYPLGLCRHRCTRRQSCGKCRIVLHRMVHRTFWEKYGKNNRNKKIVLHHDSILAEGTTSIFGIFEGGIFASSGLPDLAPDDFYLYPEMKKKMRGLNFDTAEALMWNLWTTVLWDAFG